MNRKLNAISYLSVNEAAEYVGKKLNEPFSKKDMYQLALDDKISIYVYFQRRRAQEVLFSPPENYFIISQGSDQSPLETGSDIITEEQPFGLFATIISVMDTPILTEHSQHLSLFKITGKPNEFLDGHFKIDVQKNPFGISWINSLRAEVSRNFFSLDGMIVLDQNKRYLQLIDRRFNQDIPCVNPPNESELLVSSVELKSFLNSELKKDSLSQGIDPRKEESYLNTISALIDLLLVSTNSKVNPTYTNKEEIKGEILSRFEKIKGLSKSNIEKIFAEVSKHIEKSSKLR